MGKNNSINQEKRLKDFHERKQVDPQSVEIVNGRTWECIAVHPFSDDRTVLRRLGIKPGDCIQVDSYWMVDDDVVFWQVYASTYLSSRKPGLYARWSCGEIGQLAGVTLQLTLVERALEGELTHQLGYDKHSPAGRNSRNSRNGTTPKTVKGKRGEMRIKVPRDRNSEFEPQLIKKRQTRFNGFDDKILPLYARGIDLPGDTRTPGGDLWCRGVTRPDLDSCLDSEGPLATWQYRR